MDANKYRTAYDKAQGRPARGVDGAVPASGARAGCPIGSAITPPRWCIRWTKTAARKPCGCCGGQLYSRQLRDTGRVESWFTDCGARMGQDIEGFVANARQQYVQAGLAEEQRAEAEANQKAGRGRFRIRPASAFAPGACRLSGAALPAPGMISILGGRVRCGKTSLALDVCARLTPGRCLCAGGPAAAPRHRALPYRRERPQQGAASPRRGHGGRP